MAKRIKPKELHPSNERTSWQGFWKNLWYGVPPVLIDKKAETGRVNASTRRKVTRRINRILLEAEVIKIGVTGDTWVRMDATDYRGSFDFVERVYMSTSEKVVIEYEVELIKKFKKSDPEKVSNLSTNKAGKLTSYNGFYYIYIVYNVH